MILSEQEAVSYLTDPTQNTWHDVSGIAFLKGIDLNYISASHDFLKACGKDENTLEGKSVFDLFDEKVAKRYHQEDLELLEAHQDLKNQIELIVGKDQNIKYYERFKQLIKDDEGHTLGIYGEYLDRTREIQQEEEKERSGFSQIIFDNIMEADLSFDTLLRCKGSYFETLDCQPGQTYFSEVIALLDQYYLEPHNGGLFATLFSRDALHDAYEEGTYVFEHQLDIRINGECVEVLCKCRLYHSEISKTLKVVLCFKTLSQPILKIDGSALDLEREAQIRNTIEHYAYRMDAHDIVGVENGLACTNSRHMLYQCLELMRTECSLQSKLYHAIRDMCTYLNASVGYIHLWSQSTFPEVYASNRHSLPALDKIRLDTKMQASLYNLFKDIDQLYFPDLNQTELLIMEKEKWLEQGIKALTLIPIRLDHLVIGMVAFGNTKVPDDGILMLRIYTDYIAKDVERIEASRLADKMKHYDCLTESYHLESFKEKAHAIIRYDQDKKYAFIYFDIIFFSTLNEKYGSALGDELLKCIARCAKRETKQEEIVSRISADYFCALWKYESLESLKKDYKKFEVEMKLCAKQYGFEEEVELSVGCYCIQPGESMSTALDCAAKAHKIAKVQHKKGLFLLPQEVLQCLEREHKMIQYFPNALSQGEIDIYIQPQYEYTTGTIVGGEALARWKNKYLGQISPGEFIPLLEKYGIVYELDKYIWERTCQFIRHAKDVLGEYQVPPISINLSRQDIQQEGLCNELLRLLNLYQLTPKALKIELTETAYLANQKALLTVALELKRLGFQCQLDDFGTGYSSLNTLNEIPIDVLKLDRSLVQGSEQEERKGNLLTSVVRMAHWMNLALIAEGVETLEQATFLEKIGCTYMQGYLFSYPVASEEFIAILKARVVHTSLR